MVRVNFWVLVCAAFQINSLYNSVFHCNSALVRPANNVHILGSGQVSICLDYRTIIRSKILKVGKFNNKKNAMNMLIFVLRCQVEGSHYQGIFSYGSPPHLWCRISNPHYHAPIKAGTGNLTCQTCGTPSVKIPLSFSIIIHTSGEH